MICESTRGGGGSLEVDANHEFQNAAAGIGGIRGIAESAGDLAEAGAAGRDAAEVEVRDVQDVESLSTEFDVGLFADAGALQQADIEVFLPGSAKLIEVGELAGRGLRSDVRSVRVQHEAAIVERRFGVVDDVDRQVIDNSDSIGAGGFVHADLVLQLFERDVVQDDAALVAVDETSAAGESARLSGLYAGGAGEFPTFDGFLNEAAVHAA